MTDLNRMFTLAKTVTAFHIVNVLSDYSQFGKVIGKIAFYVSLMENYFNFFSLSILFKNFKDFFEDFEFDAGTYLKIFSFFSRFQPYVIAQNIHHY